MHYKDSGTGGIAYLGRSWMPAAKVVFAYTEMSDAVNPERWSIVKPEHERSSMLTFLSRTYISTLSNS